MFGKFIEKLLLFFLFIQVSLGAFASVSVPFTLTENLANDKTVIVASSGSSVGWGNPEIDGAGLTGICVGGFGGGFNWNEKYIDIAFSGVPDTLSFEGEAAALTTGVRWAVRESADGKTWSSKIWESSDRMVRNVKIPLSENTRYVRLSYSGNFRACFSDVTITSKYRLVVNVGDRTAVDRYISKNTPLEFDTIDVASDDPCRRFGSWSPEVPAVMPASDMTFDAVFDQLSYVAHFITKTPTVETEPYDLSFLCGEPVVVATPVQPGFTFLGWTPSLPLEATASIEDQTFTAQWEKTQFRYVVYTSEDDSIVEYHYMGDALSPLQNPEREGYEFLSWNCDVPQQMPASDLIVKPVWRAIPYTFTLKVDGSVYYQKTLHIGDAIDLSDYTEPFKSGFSFAGWGIENFPDVMPAADLLYEAQWTRADFNLILVKNSDDLSMNDTIGYNAGDRIKSVDDPKRFGYTFLGWDEDVPEYMPNHDLTLTALWQINNYRYVVYTTEEDSVVKTLHAGDPLESLTEPERMGYEFLGWNPVQPEVMPESDLTIRALWNKISYRYVVYLADDDSIVSLKYYQNPLESLDTPTREGYQFKGWNVDQPASMPAHNLTIRAVWEVNKYQVTLYTDPETVYLQQTIAYGDDFVLEGYQDPTRSGYSFKGWNGQFPETMPSKDLSFDAEWEALPFKLVVVNDADDVSKNDTFTYDCDAKIRALEIPSKIGSTFKKWNMELPQVMPASDLLVVAEWEANVYSLEFYVEGELFASAPYKYQDVVDYESVEMPVREGYIFKGWQNAPETMPADDVSLEATWSAGTYEIVVVNDPDDLSQNDTISYEYGQTIQPLATPKKVGYVFQGWRGTLPDVMPAENLSVEAQWTIGSFTLTTLVNCEPTIKTYTYGETVSVDQPEKAGYAFNGWSDNVPATMPGHDVLLIADMSLLSYNFVTKVDEAKDTVVYKYTETIVVPSSPEKMGFTFDSWSPMVPETMPAEDVLVEAQWNRNSYVLTYLSDADTLAVDTLLYEEKVSYPGDPQKEGNTFVGWSESVPESMPAEDVTLHAEWKVNSYELVVVTEDTLRNRYLYGAVLPELDEPTRTGYAFDGWNKEMPATMPSHDDTIVAKWSKNNYVLSWIIGEDDTLSVEYSYEDPIVPIEDPVRKGYEFLGWDNDIPAVMPARPVELVAEWKPIDYLLTIVVDGASEVHKYKYDEEIEKPVDPQITGYTFQGWNPAFPERMPDSSVTVVADFSVNVYRLIALLESDTLSIHEYEYNEDVKALEIPEKIGWEFSEWVPSVPNLMPASDVTVEASMKQLYYTFVKIVDEDTMSYTLTYGETLPSIETPVKRGYQFDRWSKELPETMPLGNDTIEAIWTPNTYLLTLVIMEDSTVVKEIAYDSPVAVDATYERKGYRFLGWNEDMPSVMPAFDVTLVAKWERTLFSVTYLLDADTIAVDSVEMGEPIVAQIVTREGWTFDGWMPELPTEMVAEDLTVEAQMHVNTYTIALVVGEDTTLRTYNFNAKVIVPSDPKVEGYTFVEWSDTFPAVMPARDLLIEATMRINTHNLIVDMDGVADTIQYVYGAEIAPLATPTKNGYLFKGWSETLPETMPDYDIVVSPLWENDNYKLYLVVDGDTIVNQYRYGDQVANFPNPGIEGGFFVGWSEPIPTTMPNKDVLIEARFEMKKYKLTVVDSLSADLYTVYNIPCRDTIRLENLEHKGYEFQGWNTTLPELMPDSNLYVTAIWKLNQYSFVVILDEDTLMNKVYAYGDSVVAPKEPSIAEGYIFNKWSDTIPTLMPDHDVVITALINVNTYDMIFISEEDTIGKYTYAYGVKIEKDKIEIPSRVGYTFEGWSEVVPQKMPASNLVFVALWSAKDYAITYVVDGDTSVVRYECNATIEDFKPEAAEGYEFVGWKPALPNKMPAKNLMTVAQFEMKTYEFAYVTHKGTVAISYNFGDTIEVTADPERKGYTFVSWSDSIPMTMPSHDVKVNAVWKATEYQLTLVSDGKVYRRTMVAYGDSLDLPKTILKSGYLFKGWDELVPDKMPAQDVTLTARFKPTGEMLVYTHDQKLYVLGLPDDTNIVIFDALGRVVYRGPICVVELMKNGTYIVRAKHQTQKVLVR